MAFDGKVVIITGGSSGIGAATALHFSELGAQLVLAGRNATKLGEVATECTTNKKPLVIIADVSKEVDNERIIKETIDAFGQLDVLINNAGAGVAVSIETTTLADFDHSISTNVRGAYHLTMLAVPHLIETRGNIVNVSSVAGIRSFPNFLPYCVSKAAMDQMTKCVALELAPKGVRVNAVNPATIVTKFHTNMGMDESAYTEYLERAKETHALGRPGLPLEVAKSIAFLANNDSASFTTGTLLLVDGGKGVMCPR